MTRIPDFDWSAKDAARWKAMMADPAIAPAISHFLEVVCGIHSVPFHPGQPDLSAFDGGRLWAARQLARAITLPFDTKSETTDERRDHRPISATERAARAAVERNTGRRGSAGPGFAG